MKRAMGLVLGSLAAGGVVAWLVVHFTQPRTPTRAASGRTAPPVPAPSLPIPPRWAYANEEAWIVGQTSRDIVEMILYARDHSVPSGERLAFSVTSEAAPGAASATPPRYVVAFSPAPGMPKTQSLGFATYIWAPESYEPLAAAVLAAVSLPPATPSSERLASEALTNPLSGVLARQSQRVSQRLETAMLDAGAHEQAALIVGALALRDAAGQLTDVRHELCRMSAHLAVARALRRGTPSLTASDADALLLTLANRQKDALARIDLLERAQPATDRAALLRALRIRITRDWRILKDPGRATLVERLQHFRAVQQSLDASHALTFLRSFRPEPIGDWGRVAFHIGVSVEEGNVFSASLATLELNEAAEVWRILHGAPPPEDKMIEALNAPPERLVSAGGAPSPAPHVIGWGTWARFFQRHLVFAHESSVRFQLGKLGNRDDARRWCAGFDEAFSPLELWPSETLLCNTFPPGPTPPGGRLPDNETKRREACARGVPLLQTAPERVPSRFWSQLNGECREARDDRSMPDQGQWMRTLTPAGTALMLRQRTTDVDEKKPDARQVFGALYELAPFDTKVLSVLAPKRDEATADQVTSLYGPLTEYDIQVMKLLAWTRRADGATSRALYERIAALVPDEYLDLGDYLVDAGFEDEAAAAYEKAIAKAGDRVGVSNGVRWLVGYYCDRSRTDRARAVAEIAADVGSATGFQTMGYFFERMGRYGEARDWYEKIVERYGERGATREPLENFYIRYAHRVGDGRFGGEAAAAVARVFPDGLERVSLAELHGPPTLRDAVHPVRVPGDSQRDTRFGLLKDDVVVALNGYRVHNERQYRLLWTFDDRPEATVIVWRQGRHVEVKGQLKHMAYGPPSRRL